MAKIVDTLLEEHDRGRRDNSHWLWMLLMLEVWFRQEHTLHGTVQPQHAY